MSRFVILQLLNAIVTALYILILARAIGSFFIRDWYRGLPRLLFDLTEPILAPVRRLLPPMSGLDFSPMIVVIGLILISNFVSNLAR